MSDIDIRKDGLYQGKPYGFDQAIEEATKIKKLVGEAATAERYQLASNIITARLEEDEIYTLANSTIPRLEPLVQSAQLFNELVGQYLSKHSSEITAQSPLSRDNIKNHITTELEVKLYRDWDIANHREKYADYQKDLSLKRTQLAKISSAFLILLVAMKTFSHPKMTSIPLFSFLMVKISKNWQMHRHDYNS